MSVQRIEELVLPIKRLSREDFIQQYPDAFLISQVSKNQESGRWQFRTKTVSSEGLAVGVMLHSEGFVLSPELVGQQVFVLDTPGEGGGQGRVSIGRARNNDIVFLDISVSKLHAYLRPQQNGHWTVEDVRSRNGTLLNGWRLQSGEQAPLKSGDEIHFGRVEIVYLEPGALYDFVAARVRRRGTTA